MRNVIAIALLLFTLFHAAGYLFVFEIQKYEIRREIKQQIKAGVPEAELVLLKISGESSTLPFQRIDEHEFRYGGNMYDIVREEARGDTIWYYCLADEKETQLFADLDELVKRDMNQNTARHQKIEKLLHLLGPCFFSSRDEAPWVDSAEEVELTTDWFGLKIWIDPPPTPPPKA